ncbi:MAG TPA: NF038122 family metalloprotease [Pyrinomonadaceae bacterium]|nr:NF038122 family metalloprotease [Pyrinomonadaceae bacterium]
MKRIGKLPAFFLLCALVHTSVAPLGLAQKQALTSPPPIRKYTPTLETEQQGFIIYQSDGEVACRDATEGEAREIDRRDPDVKLTILRDEAKEIGLLRTEQYSANAEATGLKIILRGTTRLDQQYPDVKAAFIRAAAVWESLIKSDITVVIDVDYGPDRFGKPWEANVLGSTSGVVFTQRYNHLRQRLQTRSPGAEELSLYNALRAGSLPTSQGAATEIRVVSPVARAIGITSQHADPNDPDKDISIGFNSSFTFDFNPDDGITQGLTDFDAVAVHEMGHALGFTSSVRNQGATSPIEPSVWDIFRFRPGTATLATFGTAERVLTTGASSTDQHVCFNGGPELQLSTGNADGDGGDEEQSSHWKDDRFGGPYIGIMDPTIRASRRFQITDNDRKAINTFGYIVGTPLPTPPTPANDNFANAAQISGVSGTVAGSTVSATKEPGEPSNIPDTTGGWSVWYRWQAPASGTAVIDTVGSGYDTTLAVYRGSSVAALSLVPNGANDDIIIGDDVESRVTVSVTAGEVYYIVVDGFDGDYGNITLNWSISGATPTPTPTPIPWISNAQFTGANYAANESDGKATITVVRTGDTSGAGKVAYATRPDAAFFRCDVVNGQASERCDYSTTVGTLRFGAGEIQKSFVIPVADDAFVEGTESVSLTLYTPTTANVSAATLTIQDNDATSPTTANNPFNGNSFFVRQHYLDFLAREPDAGGFNDWLNVLNTCGPGQGNLGSPTTCDRIHVSSGFYRSPEFTDRGYFVYRFYEAALASRPLYAEFIPDMASLSGFQTSAEQEQNIAEFVAKFMGSPGFVQRYGTPTSANAAAFIAQLETAAQVQIAEPRRTQLISEMGSGQKTAAQTLRAFVESQQVYDKFFFRGFVAMQYFGYLRRDPDTAGYNDWVDVLTNGRASARIGPGDYRHMIRGFVYSVEYRERFGQP